MSAAAALVVATALAGCGSTTYFAGRTLPPSGLTNRVMVAIQNPSSLSKGALEIMDAYYDRRSGYNSTPSSYSISGYGGALPLSIQSMPEEQFAVINSANSGSVSLVSYSQEKVTSTVSGLSSIVSDSLFITRSGSFVFSASQQSQALTVINETTSTSYSLSLPGAYRVSVNPGGSAALAFVKDTNYAYYTRQLTAAQTTAYSGGSATWPKAAMDCEPQNAPGWCLFQAQSPDNVDSTGNYYGTPLVFDRPVKAVFSSDGSTAYVVNCGPECGGTKASVSVLPVAPLIFTLGKQSGLLPCNTAATSCANSTDMTTIDIAGGASNALVDGSTMYVVGQSKMSDGYWGGYLTLVDLSTNALATSTSSSPNPVSISDGVAGGASHMLEADDNTLWIGMTKCNQGERYYNNLSYGCLTMYNTSTKQVTLLEPYIGDLTGIAGVTGLHKIYVAQGGQVYIYSTTDGVSINNEYVTVTGTAYDVAYMDAVTDTNNTVY
jgi:hypothetical protein